MKTFSQPLSALEEAHYLKLYHEGSEEEAKRAEAELIEHNLRLVAHVIKKYQNVPEEQEDMISYGTIGLMKGIKTFVPGKGSRLSTYAAKCIENEILMMLRGHKKRSREVSLFEPIGTDKEGNEIRLMDVMEAEQDDIIGEIELRDDIVILRKVMKQVLDKREYEIITYRYGMRTGEEMTQRELGKKLGISRSYVSRIEKRALEKLRRKLEGNETVDKVNGSVI